MDDSTNKSPESPAAKSANADISFAVVFGVIGFTLLMTLDTPWASMPMLAVAGYYVVKSLRDAHRQRKATAEAPDA